MITHFEEGSALVERCSKKLSEVELKIEKLVKRGESLERESFDSEE
jgi:exodeoxyribonuclease VII small subunit